MMNFGAVCPSDCIDLTQDPDRVDDVEAFGRLPGCVDVDCTLKSFANPRPAIALVEPLSRPLQGFALGFGLGSLFENKLACLDDLRAVPFLQQSHQGGLAGTDWTGKQYDTKFRVRQWQLEQLELHPLRRDIVDSHKQTGTHHYIIKHFFYR